MKSCRLSGRPRRGVSIAARDPIMQGASKPMDDSDSPDTTHPNDYSQQEVEQHFAELVAGVEDHAIFLLDPNGIVKSWNAGARRIKGYEADEIIGQPFTRFYTEDAIDSGWPQEELKRAAAAGRFQDEGWRLRKDGTQIWANVVITALRAPDGEVRGFLKITRDLTERRQAEETLRLSEERLRLLIESVQDYAIFMLDPEGRIASWNPGAERIKGYKAAEIIGQHFSIFYSSEDVASGKPQRELETALREGRVEDEGWRVRKDRSQFWANVIITAVYDRQGTLRGFAKITRDMTDKQRVVQLQLADKQKNEFLAMLAHELRNPLAPIRNGVELLKMSRTAEPEVHETTRMMERQVVHLVRLVDDLLDVSRIVTGKIHLDTEPIDVNEVVDRAIEEVQPTLDARGHELMLTRPARQIIVNGDMVRLAQVVSNLLSNAAKYTEKPSQIWLAVEPRDKEVLIRIRDPGVGMEAEDLSRVFNLFEQADSSISRFRGGLGIGLTLVKRIVELHGGSVSATSPGLSQGSEFVIRLPASEATSAANQGFHSAREMKRQMGRRILVVDDNVDAAISVAQMLKNWGHEVQTAFNGPDAIEKAKTYRPQIVLLDIGMPGMSGYEVAKQLRAQQELEGVIITALTGYGQAEDRSRSREAGFNHHLTKPPDPKILAALLESPHTFADDTWRNN
jgi:PAS domain S-box-containing protein